MVPTLKQVLLTAGIFAVKTSIAQPVECPVGWYETNGRCFRVLAFDNNAKQSWESAMETCAAHGTPLATIHTHEEEALISSLSARYKGECWTGLRKYKKFKPDKGWMWIDRDEALDDDDYLHWGKEWQSVWKILPPDEKCGTIKNDGWGNRPCWGPGSKLQCFVCGTLDANASDRAKSAFQNNFSTGNWWIPSPSSNVDNSIGNADDGWDIKAQDTGDSVSIEDPNTFWSANEGETNGGIDPSLLRTVAPTTTTTTTPKPTTTTTIRTTTTTTPKRRTTTTTTTTPTTTPRPTTRTTTTTVPPTTTTTQPQTTRKPTVPPTTTTVPPTTTTVPPTTTTVPPTTTTVPPTTTTTIPPTTTRTSANTQDEKDFGMVNDVNEENDTEPPNTSSIKDLAYYVGGVTGAGLCAGGIVGLVRYLKHRRNALAASGNNSPDTQSSPETQSFTDIEDR